MRTLNSQDESGDVHDNNRRFTVEMKNGKYTSTVRRLVDLEAIYSNNSYIKTDNSDAKQ